MAAEMGLEIGGVRCCELLPMRVPPGSVSQGTSAIEGTWEKEERSPNGGYTPLCPQYLSP